MVKLKDSGFPVGSVVLWGGHEYEVKAQYGAKAQNGWWAQRKGDVTDAGSV